MTQILKARFLVRSRTAAEWTSLNEVLLASTDTGAREMGMEEDTGKFKLGDGTTAWNDLAYFTPTATQAYDWIIALGDETTEIVTGASVVTIRAPRAMTLTKVKASLSGSGSTGSTFDVNLNGTSIFSTTLTIDASEKTSETASTAAVLSTTSIATDDELTFDIDTAGTGATGAKITLVATS
jgi:hypothetical protein